MEKVESPIDTLVNSVRFSVSNVTSIAIWGGLDLFVTVVFLAFYFVGIFSAEKYVYVGIILVLLSMIPLLLFSLLFAGFLCQCMKTILNGGTGMPLGFENPVALVKDGFMIAVIYLEAMLLSFIFFIPGTLLLIFVDKSRPAYFLIGMLLLIIACVPVIVIVFLNMIQWVVYADTGSLLRGLNPLNALRPVISNPFDAVITAVFIGVIYFIFYIVTIVCEFTCCPMILLPFLLIIEMVAIIYLITAFYVKSKNGKTSAC